MERTGCGGKKVDEFYVHWPANRLGIAIQSCQITTKRITCFLYYILDFYFYLGTFMCECVWIRMCECVHGILVRRPTFYAPIGVYQNGELFFVIFFSFFLYPSNFSWLVCFVKERCYFQVSSIGQSCGVSCDRLF